MWNLVRARQRHHRALRLWRAGHLRRGQQHVVRAIALYEGTDVVELAGALLTLADFQFQLARYAEAEATLRRAISPLEAAPRDTRCHATLVDARIRLANSQRRQGKLDVAEATLRGAIGEHAERALPMELLSAANNALGVVYKDAGRYAEAADRYAAALAASTHTDLTASIHHNLAGLAHAEGRFTDAVTPARTALALHRRERGPTATEVAADAAVLGAVLLGLGHLDEAEAQLSQAYRIWVRRFGPDHYEVAVCLHGLGVVRYRRGDPEAALRSLDEALRIKTSVLGPDHPEVTALRQPGCRPSRGRAGQPRVLDDLGQLLAGQLTDLTGAQQHGGVAVEMRGGEER
jgi:tetratricopeptide (TPR) repeat protein